MIKKTFKTMKKKFNNINIKNKLMLSYVLLILIPLIILSIVTYMKVSKNTEENMLRAAEKALEQSSSHLEYKLDYVLNATKLVVFDNTLQEILMKTLSEYDDDFLQQKKDQDKITGLLVRLQNDLDIFRVRLYIREIPGYRYNDGNFFILNDIIDADWYKKLETGGDIVTWFPPRYFTQEDNSYNQNIVAIARRIWDLNTYKKTIGIVRIDVRESIIRDTARTANISNTGVCYIVNSNNEIITSSGNTDLIANESFREILENSSFSEMIWNNLTFENNRYLALFTNISNTDWRFISIISYSEIQRPGREIRDFILIVMLLTAILTYAAAYYIANSSTSRLRTLNTRINQVKNGNFNARVIDSSRDEIGQISSSFNFMVQEMAQMIEERFMTGKKIKSLELRALQAQINPHFLYNSLDMINWTAAINGINEIEIMVQALSKFYKLGLSKGREVISIRDEIEYVKAYVTIQNLRFEDRIRLEVDINEDLSNYGILKITLQPLVENAIQHGIICMKGKSGTIKISAHYMHGLVVLEVQDGGVGMPEEALVNIFNSTSQDDYHGYGIKNIDDRIKLHYGNEYGLSFSSALNVGTTATITIPAIRIE